MATTKALELAQLADSITVNANGEITNIGTLSSLDISGQIDTSTLNTTDRIRVSDTATKHTEVDHGGAYTYITTRNDNAYGGFIVRSYNGTTYLKRLQVEQPSGDIQFYRNVGGTEGIGLHWDYNDGNLGLGLTSPNEPLSIKTRVAAYFPGIKVENYNTTDGIYVQNILGYNTGIGTGRYYNSGFWRSDVTDPTTVRLDGGVIRFYAQSGVTTDADYTPTERMRIDGSTGNVGIGNTNPQNRLHIRSASGGTARIQFDDGVAPRVNYVGMENYEQIVISADDTAVAGAVPKIIFKTKSLERMRIDEAGRVGIGTTNPGNYAVSIKGRSNGYGLQVISDAASEPTFFANGFYHAGNLAGSSLFTLQSDNSTGNSSRSQLFISGNTNSTTHRFGIGINTSSEVAYLATQSKANTAIAMPLEFRVNNIKGLEIDENVNVVVTNDLSVGGNLTISGNTTVVNTTNLEVDDAVITLNNGQATPLNDIGILFQRYATANTTNYNVAFAWDESADAFVFGKTADTGTENPLTFTESLVGITQSARLGIGTVSPGTPLHLVNSNPVIRLEDDNGSDANIDANGGNLRLYADGWIGMYPANSATPTLYAATNGNIGIGTTNPVSTAGSDTFLQIYNSVDAGLSLKTANGDWDFKIDNPNGDLSLYQAGSRHFIVQKAGGNVGIGTASPIGKFDVKSGQAGFEFFPENTTDTNLILNYDRTSNLYQNLQTRAATHQFLIGTSEAMRVHSNGKVGIGTSNPNANYPLHVNGIVYAQAGIQIDSGYKVNFGNPNQYIRGVNDTLVEIATGATVRLTILNSGNVGIGTTNPQSDLEIQSKTTSVDAVISLTAAGARRYQIKALTSTGHFTIHDESLATERMRITSTGDVGIGTTTIANKLDVQGAIASRRTQFLYAAFDNTLDNSLRIRANAGNANVTDASIILASSKNGSAQVEYIQMDPNGNFLPLTTTQDLGSTTNPWQNIYTQDLVLSNESRATGNDIDGTKGNWTVQEGEDHLYLINNKNGKKYRFALEEIE